MGVKHWRNCTRFAAKSAMVGVAIAALRMVRTELLRGLRIATSAPRRVNGFVEDRLRSRRPETVECRLRLHTCGSLRNVAVGQRLKERYETVEGAPTPIRSCSASTV